MSENTVCVKLRRFLDFNTEKPKMIYLAISTYISHALLEKIQTWDQVEGDLQAPAFFKESLQDLIITVKKPLRYEEAVFYLIPLIKQWHEEECGITDRYPVLEIKAFEAFAPIERFTPQPAQHGNNRAYLARIELERQLALCRGESLKASYIAGEIDSLKRYLSWH